MLIIAKRKFGSCFINKNFVITLPPVYVRWALIDANIAVKLCYKTSFKKRLPVKKNKNKNALV